MGMNRIAVSSPTISPLVAMAAAAFIAGMVLPMGVMSSKYEQIRRADQQGRTELAQAQRDLAREQQVADALEQRLQLTQQQLRAASQAMKAQSAQRPVAPGPATEQSPAAAASVAAAAQHAKAVAAQEQRDNNDLQREVRALRARVAELAHSRPAHPATPKPPIVAHVPPKTAPHPEPPARVALAATDAATVGIRQLEHGMVLLANGERVLVGQQFPSGETLLGVDPASDEVRTNKRTLLLFFKR